jgi:hypothetical protein
LACPELAVTRGLGDGHKLHLHQDSFGIAVDGSDEVRHVALLCLREGFDTIKLNISGDAGHRHYRRRGRGERRGCPRDRSAGGGSRTRLGAGEVHSGTASM